MCWYYYGSTVLMIGYKNLFKCVSILKKSISSITCTLVKNWRTQICLNFEIRCVTFTNNVDCDEVLT